MFLSFQCILPENLVEETLLLLGGDCKAGSAIRTHDIYTLDWQAP